jgi:hypothetical protein
MVFAETVIQITKRPLKNSSETRKVHVERRWAGPGPEADVQHRAAGGASAGRGWGTCGETMCLGGRRDSV